MEEQTQQRKTSSYAIPAAILVAGLLVSGTLYFTRSAPAPTPGISSASVTQNTRSGSPATKNIQPVTSGDHILGEANAPVKLVEFSDLECPFCKRFHGTMKQIMAEYGTNGQVAWVWRHFPLTSIHPKAVKSAAATECANELGGSDGFWRYIDRYFEVTPSNNNIDLNQLPLIAEYIGLDRGQFETCLASNKYDEHIRADFEDAVNSGGTGTPYSVVIAPDGTKLPVIGAQQYEVVKSVIEQALR